VEQVDIWNVIECFRENGLNTLEADTELNASRVEAILASVFTQLNKRVPVTRQVDVATSSSMLLNWLISAYDRYCIRHQPVEQWWYRGFIIYSYLILYVTFWLYLCAGMVVVRLQKIDFLFLRHFFEKTNARGRKKFLLCQIIFFLVSQ